MSDILIYTNEETLLHKRNKIKDSIDKSYDGKYFWEFGNPPKRIKEVKKIYFAINGFIVGYFRVHNAFSDIVEWKYKTWTPLKNPIPHKPFQGFKYVDIDSDKDKIRKKED